MFQTFVVSVFFFTIKAESLQHEEQLEHFTLSSSSLWPAIETSIKNMNFKKKFLCATKSMISENVAIYRYFAKPTIS